VIEAVISDFGGVVTVPLGEAFTRANAQIGIPAEALGQAMRIAAAHDGEPPIFKLERGQITEGEFLTVLAQSLERVLGHAVDLDGYGERLMGEMKPNGPLLDYYRSLQELGIRFAICTNNVREWQPRWLPMLPPGLFEEVVDSGFEGTRKPEPEIYELCLTRLGLAAESCVFVDDLEINVTAARELGLHGVRFRDTAQAVAEIGALFELG
jgi:epoxide hydrolase-like predicted phosphatase